MMCAFLQTNGRCSQNHPVFRDDILKTESCVRLSLDRILSPLTIEFGCEAKMTLSNRSWFILLLTIHRVIKCKLTIKCLSRESCNYIAA